MQGSLRALFPLLQYCLAHSQAANLCQLAVLAMTVSRRVNRPISVIN